MKVRITRHPLRSAGIAIALLVALAAVALGVWRPWAPLQTAAPVGAAAGAEGTTSTVIAPAPLALPENPTVLVFGDSWTYGSAATLPTEGYAYLLGDLLDGTT